MYARMCVYIYLYVYIQRNKHTYMQLVFNEMFTCQRRRCARKTYSNSAQLKLAHLKLQGLGCRV